MREIVKEAWTSWARAVLPPDAPAVQLVETRRAFYAGFAACMTAPINSVEDAEWAHQEIQKFFDDEVETGFGIPPQPTKKGGKP